MLKIARKLIGSSNERRVSKYQPRVQRINALEPEYSALTDGELRGKTVEFRERLREGATLDLLLEPAFAAVREAAKRTLGQRHYDVQLVGGMVLHDGDISEMRTGEGKTLVATLAVYLNALTGKGVHVVTVNDYLARRDAEWMGRIYKFLGLNVGVIVHGLTDAERKTAYSADVTYGTNNEFGFDYLRDNMKYSLADMSQRGHHFAIVDEVDSILIDEARTPLIISGPTDDRSDFYRTIDKLIPLLDEEDYDIDEKQRSVALSEEGNEHIEQLLLEHELIEDGGLYDVANVSIVHHLNQALRAHKLFKRDRDYIVRKDQVILIDEFTGRMMEGRRLSEGLHQAIEAKEDVTVQPENVTLASITFQNYFRLYDKLAGMTGTASTEASEFQDIYGLDVVTVPTNREIQRIDDDDVVYRTAAEKNKAILEEIIERNKSGQPMLVGTASIEKSEELSALLKKARVKHQVLNARYHEQEAQIIAQAGHTGAVTIATNMAGRGTDIQLGGNVDMRIDQWIAAQEQKRGERPDEDAIAAQRTQIEREIEDDRQRALAAGGLYVIGSERHESRRIDNQLRGRSGRQGDPGRSKFFVSVEDDLMRIFAPERMNAIMKTLGMKEGEAIVHPWMSKALETAQKRVEQRNFEMRKNVLKYDDVTNNQRKAIFEQRIEFMSADDVSEVIRDMRHELVQEIVARHVPPKAYADQWNIKELSEDAHAILDISPPIQDWADEDGIADEEICERLIKAADAAYAEKVVNVGGDNLRKIEKQILLQTIDLHWREHLQHLDHLRSVIHLRSYGQRDPLNEFKTEAFSLFEKLLSGLREDVTRIVMTLRIQQAPPPPRPLEGAIATRAPMSGMIGGRPTGPVGQDRETGSGQSILSSPGPALGGGIQSDIQPPRRPAPSHYRSPAAPERDPNNPETWGRVGRNETCPCGSGRKYKHCHGAVTIQA